MSLPALFTIKLPTLQLAQGSASGPLMGSGASGCLRGSDASSSPMEVEVSLGPWSELSTFAPPNYLV